MPAEPVRRTALVTGAGRGLGRAVALELAARGYDLALLARSPEELTAVAGAVVDRGRAALPVPADVTRGADLETAALLVRREFGRLDLLVNNAGVELNGPLHRASDEEFDRIFGVNTRGVFLALRAFFPILAEAGGAAVVNVASAAGLVGMPYAALYGGAKAAVIHMTRALAVEWRAAKIRVNCVCPGFIRTEMAARGLEALKETGLPVDALVGYRQGRLGLPEEVASAVAFLASPEAAFVNGHALAVDGGASAN